METPHGDEEASMTEQPQGPQRPTDDEPPRSGGDEHGKVRTDGETGVDDALGSGDNVH
jgi:hypothetical protein